MKKHSQKLSTEKKPAKMIAKTTAFSTKQKVFGANSPKSTKRIPVQKRTGSVRPPTDAANAKQKPRPLGKKPQSKPLGKAKPPTARRQAKAKSSVPKTEAQYTARPEKFKETWDHVLAAISKMRREKISLTQASREVGISPRTVTKWGKTALRKRPNGKYAVKASDSLLRIVLIPTPEGTREIAVRGSKQVTMLAEYWNALHRYLQTGDTEKLKQFEGKNITDANGADIPLSTDLAALNRLGSAGVLSFESLYARGV